MKLTKQGVRDLGHSRRVKREPPPAQKASMPGDICLGARLVKRFGGLFVCSRCELTPTAH